MSGESQPLNFIILISQVEARSVKSAPVTIEYPDPPPPPLAGNQTIYFEVDMRIIMLLGGGLLLVSICG